MDVAKNKYRFTVLAFVVTFSIPITIFWLQSQSKNLRHFTVRTMNDFNAVYVHEGAYVVLIQRRPKHELVILGPKEIGNIVRFTKTCILCNGQCKYNQTVSLDLTDKLYIPNFNVCTVPKSCYWYGFMFNCNDLLSITDLVTT